MKIRLSSVVKTFETFRAVRGVSLEIGSGELVALLGPSGSGKTTILRMVAGLEYVDSGDIYFGGENATDIPVRERGVGFVFQNYALFPHMTVADNIAFGMKALKTRKTQAEITARVEELLRLVQLDGLGGRFPNQISGGQRQRVAFARAIAVEPRVLLLDEPFGALDANVRRDLRRWLREIHDELGITTLFVTHDQEEALDLADRVVIMNQGLIVQDGRPEDIVARPASAFVANFLGDTNRFRAEVKGGVARLGDGLEIPALGMADGPAELFARPRDIEWSASAPGLPAKAVRILSRPAGDRLAARTEDGTFIEMEISGESPARPGETGFLRFTRARLFPLDGPPGESIA